MVQTAEQRYKNYWKNVEKRREQTRQYIYKKKGIQPAPPKRVYKLRSIEERIAIMNARPVEKPQEVPAEKPREIVTAATNPSVSFTLTENDFL